MTAGQIPSGPPPPCPGGHRPVQHQRKCHQTGPCHRRSRLAQSRLRPVGRNTPHHYGQCAECETPHGELTSIQIVPMNVLLMAHIHTHVSMHVYMYIYV